MENPLEDLLSKKAQAKAEMAKATDAANALLAELEAKDAVNATAASVAAPRHQMPPPYGPGDPVAGVAAPGDGLKSALDGSFKPVNFDNIGQTTLPSSHTVDFAQKVRDAHKPNGRQ